MGSLLNTGHNTRCPHGITWHTDSPQNTPCDAALRGVFWRVLVGALWRAAQRSPELPAPLTDELLAPRLLVCLVALDRAKPVQHPREQKVM